MKLRRELIDRIAAHMAITLDEEGLSSGCERPVLAQKIGAAITADLMMEEKLNNEVRELLAQHAEQIGRANVEYHELFKRLKAKLVRERNLIL
ncbi:MAG: DUF507 family protein [Acidobacteria bacterium]|nr:MAG: DUF507 family protein [Acidobacteriota bacterium]